MVDIAQLVRALDCGSRGRGFEPHYPPHILKYALGRESETALDLFYTVIWKTVTLIDVTVSARLNL